MSLVKISSSSGSGAYKYKKESFETILCHYCSCNCVNFRNAFTDTSGRTCGHLHMRRAFLGTHVGRKNIAFQMYSILMPHQKCHALYESLKVDSSPPRRTKKWHSVSLFKNISFVNDFETNYLFQMCCGHQLQSQVITSRLQ